MLLLFNNNKKTPVKPQLFSHNKATNLQGYKSLIWVNAASSTPTPHCQVDKYNVSSLRWKLPLPLSDEAPRWPSKKSLLLGTRRSAPNGGGTLQGCARMREREKLEVTSKGVIWWIFVTSHSVAENNNMTASDSRSVICLPGKHRLFCWEIHLHSSDRRLY